MVSHRNIQVNCEQIMAAYYEADGGMAPPDTTVVSWLPLFHDMGLILGIAFPVLWGFRTVLDEPAVVPAATGAVDANAGKQPSRLLGSAQRRFRIGDTKNIG